MATTHTTWTGLSSLSRYVRAAIEGRADAAALRHEAYCDGWTWGEIDLALVEARQRVARERTDALVRDVGAFFASPRWGA